MAEALEREMKVTRHPTMRRYSLCMFWCVSFLILFFISAHHEDIQMSMFQTQTHTLTKFYILGFEGLFFFF